jgi:hypothetical protein
MVKAEIFDFQSNIREEIVYLRCLEVENVPTLLGTYTCH